MAGPSPEGTPLLRLPSEAGRRVLAHRQGAGCREKEQACLTNESRFVVLGASTKIQKDAVIVEHDADCRTAQSLLEMLRPGHIRWDAEWVFRGQGDATWPLLPCAHRLGPWRDFPEFS